MHDNPRRTRQCLLGVVITLLAFLLASSACDITSGQSTPTPGQATPMLPEQPLPLPWPVPLPGSTQVSEARACDTKALLQERYPDSIPTGQLTDTYAVQTACDWAVLAVAWAQRTAEEEPLPPAAQNALAQALARNPALAFATPVLYTYYGTPTVQAPPLVQRRLVHARVHYVWSGLGDAVWYDIEVAALPTGTLATGSVQGRPFRGHPPEERVQALGTALTDLLPIAKPLPKITTCYDTYPEWEVTLTYEDGTRVGLTTNGSNAIQSGGPWQVEFGGQKYMQYSIAFLRAWADLADEMGLPWGRPAATTCVGMKTSLLDLLFP